jgi:hypothetical protein
LQLDQLLFAVRSPVGGAEEQKNGTLGTLQRHQGLFVAKLIASREGRGLLADPQPNRRQHFDGGYLNGIAPERSLDRNGIT